MGCRHWVLQIQSSRCAFLNEQQNHTDIRASQRCCGCALSGWITQVETQVLISIQRTQTSRLKKRHCQCHANSVAATPHCCSQNMPVLEWASRNHILHYFPITLQSFDLDGPMPLGNKGPHVLRFAFTRSIRRGRPLHIESTQYLKIKLYKSLSGGNIQFHEKLSTVSKCKTRRPLQRISVHPWRLGDLPWFLQCIVAHEGALRRQSQ